MPTPPLIVIGTSAGGVSALSPLLGGLPNDLNAPVCIARHADPTRASLLPQILSRVGTLTVAPFQSGAPLLPGHLFVAPAGHHLLIEHTQVRVLQERPKRPRDDIDRLFHSIGCCLVWLPDHCRDPDREIDRWDSGLANRQAAGGTTIIQDPEEAAFPSMPQSAQARCAIDYCLTLAHIVLLLPRLLGDMASH